jgi:hypothetical protein
VQRVSPCRRPLSSIGFDAPTATRIVNTKTKTRRKEKAFMLMAFGCWDGRSVFDREVVKTSLVAIIMGIFRAKAD